MEPRDPNGPLPHRPEVIGTFLFAPLVLAIETWRRWGELASPAALDDALVFGAALFVAWRLLQRDARAPLWWIFVCGGAWFMMALSLWGSIYSFDDGDPSGVSMFVVLAFKGFGLGLITLAAKRALGQVTAVTA